MGIHIEEKQQLQRFLGQFIKGGSKRARVFKKILKILSPFPVEKIATLLAILEKTFIKGFRKFRVSKETKLRARVQEALGIFAKAFKDLEPHERKALISISIYLLLITVTNGLPVISKVRKLVSGKSL